MTNAKRRILFLVTTADWGGAQFFVTRLAQEALRRGCHVLIGYGETGELPERCAAMGLPTTQIKTVRRAISPWHDLASIHEIRRLIQEFKPDAVHLNSGKMSIAGSIAANLERVPHVVYRIGGWSFLEDVSPLKRLAYLWPEKLTAGRKDVIVTVHPGDADAAKRHGIIPRGRLITIANGIDRTAFDAALLPKDQAMRLLGIPEDGLPVIGTVANLYPAKNLAWFVRALAPLKDKCRIIILGDGPERAKIEQAARQAGLDPNEILLGRRKDASALLKVFDLFILPSSKEGMPWSLLEAMAAGLPCIATDVGACRWMLEPDAGVVIPSGDTRALLEAASNLISRPDERERLGLNARQTVEKRFQWETTATMSLEALGLD